MNLEQQIAALKERISDLEAELSQTQGKLREVEGQIQGMKDQVTEAQKQAQRAIVEHKELNDRLEREYADKDRRLKDSLRSQMDQLIQEQMSEI